MNSLVITEDQLYIVKAYPLKDYVKYKFKYLTFASNRIVDNWQTVDHDWLHWTTKFGIVYKPTEVSSIYDLKDQYPEYFI